MKKLLIVVVGIVLLALFIYFFPLLFTLTFNILFAPKKDNKTVNEIIKKYELKVIDQKELPRNCFDIIMNNKNLKRGDYYIEKMAGGAYFFHGPGSPNSLFVFYNNNGNYPVVYEKGKFMIIAYRPDGLSWQDPGSLIIFNKDTNEYNEIIINSIPSITDNLCQFMLSQDKIFIYTRIDPGDYNKSSNHILLYDFKNNTSTEIASNVDDRCNGFSWGLDNEYLYIHEGYSEATDYFGFFSLPQTPKRFLPECLTYRKKI